MGVKFDWTISIGTLVELAAVIVAVVGMYISILRRIDKVEFKLDLIYQWFSANVLNDKD